MNCFKLGTNFDFDLLDKIIELNKNEISVNGNCSKVTELYGSIAEHSLLAARPTFRLPDIKLYKLEEYVQEASKNDIDFNYTLNSFVPYGSKQELYKHIYEVKDIISALEEMGVYRLTIANPILLEIIRNDIGSNIEIEISTCAHIDTITQMKYYHEVYNVNKFCSNLNKNRDFKFLAIAADYCEQNNIIYELMVNEFCGVGGSDYATHCIYRDSCYVCHATNETYEDTMTFDNYPMNLCTKSRNQNPANWLRLKWIRPEDLKYYNEIGLNHFKITGRTGSSEYILKTLEAYMKQDFDGNLLELWKPLESIKPGVSESDIKNLDIPNKKLDKFLSFWYNNEHNCDYEICGESCNYCSKYYDNFIKEN